MLKIVHYLRYILYAQYCVKLSSALSLHLQIKFLLLRALAKLQKANINSVISVCLFISLLVRIEQLDSYYYTDFEEI